MRFSVEVEIVRSGQPRPYADSIKEAYVTFRTPDGQLWASKYGHSEEVAKPYARLMVGDWNDSGEWYAPRLETFEQVSPGRWHVVIISPYLD